MTAETRTGFASVDELREANRRAGHHFFDADTMRGFRSRLPDQTMYGGRFFITSEQFGFDGQTNPRAYTVRIALLDGTVGGDVGGFQAWPTLRAARSATAWATAGYDQGLGRGEAITVPAYQQGRALRRFEDANAPDEYGNTRADYLREDVKRHEAKIAELRAEIARLEGGGQ